MTQTKTAARVVSAKAADAWLVANVECCDRTKDFSKSDGWRPRLW